jgi:hypothetical protein
MKVPKSPRLPKIKISMADVQNISALIMPIMLLLTTDYVYQDLWGTLTDEMKLLLFMTFIIGTLWAFQGVIKRYLK